MTRVAFYGTRGSFSEEGAIQAFPEQNVELTPCGKSVSEVFTYVSTGEAEFGVVPVENSDAGIVTSTYDLLLEEKAFVIGEVVLLIRQHLVANHGVALNQVKTIYSHPIANAQCSKFLSARPWQVVNYLDTASCVEKLAKEDLMDAAAIAGKRAVEIYNMNILKEDVQNSNTNYTRFFIIGPDRNTREGNKTSMVLGLRNGLNSLHDYLGCFVKREIRILKIDSRPSRRLPFEYVIYMDISGTPQEQKVKDAISDLWQICGFVRFIGSYEAAKIPS